MRPGQISNKIFNEFIIGWITVLQDLDSSYFVPVVQFNYLLKWGRGRGGQVVSVLAFYSDDPNSNPAAIHSFYSVKFFERTEIS